MSRSSSAALALPIVKLTNGHKKNPSLMLVTNGARRVRKNPARGIKFGSDVQAIIYRNTEVQHHPFRAHAFGGQDFTLKNGRAGELTIQGMTDRTGLECFAMPDGSVLLRFADGRPVWDDVPDTE